MPGKGVIVHPVTVQSNSNSLSFNLPLENDPVRSFKKLQDLSHLKPDEYNYLLSYLLNG
jgi:hypothetical protein